MNREEMESQNNTSTQLEFRQAMTDFKIYSTMSRLSGTAAEAQVSPHAPWICLSFQTLHLSPYITTKRGKVK